MNIVCHNNIIWLAVQYFSCCFCLNVKEDKGEVVAGVEAVPDR